MRINSTLCSEKVDRCLCLAWSELSAFHRFVSVMFWLPNQVRFQPRFPYSPWWTFLTVLIVFPAVFRSPSLPPQSNPVSRSNPAQSLPEEMHETRLSVVFSSFSLALLLKSTAAVLIHSMCALLYLCTGASTCINLTTKEKCPNTY